MVIAHIVHRDKFTRGYINFMKKYMSDYVHYFVVLQGQSLNLVDELNVYFLSDYRNISDEVRNILNHSDLIVFTGVFDSLLLLERLSRRLLKKTYLQFWGGDIYAYKERKALYHIRYNFQKGRRRYIYNKCAGFIFLIDGEQKEFEEAFHIKKNLCFVVPMPQDDIYEVADYIHRLRLQPRKKGPINILIGNSASSSNQHIEALQWMEKYKPNGIKIYMPLSYGSDEYRNEIIEFAKNKFGNAVVPILNYMNKANYIEFLSQMDIAIMNTNRQQAMGNINLILALGKKLFIRKETPMWSKYCLEGYKVFPAEAIMQMDFQHFIEFSDSDKQENERIYDLSSNYDYAERSWKYFIEHSKIG